MTDFAEEAGGPPPGAPSGRVVVVSGASRGLGRAAALALADPAIHLVLLARTVGALEEVDDAVRAAGGQATLVPLDLTDGEAVARLGPALCERFGRVDGLVSCAAVLGELGPVAHSDAANWRSVLELNLFAAQGLIAVLDPLLRASPAGRVAVVTCAAAIEAKAYWNAYAVSKAALEALVRLYAAETARLALKVNLFDPGPMATRLRATAFPGEDRSALASPESVAGALVRLVAADWTASGQRLTPDLLA